jgi:hypothetical protein
VERAVQLVAVRMLEFDRDNPCPCTVSIALARSPSFLRNPAITTSTTFSAAFILEVSNVIQPKGDDVLSFLEIAAFFFCSAFTVQPAVLGAR